MEQLEQPEMNRWERIARDHILPALPSSFRDPGDLDEGEVHIAQSILAKQYVEHANLGVLWKTGLILLVYDSLFVFQSQIYGLVLSVLGSLSLALPTLHTPETLLNEVKNQPEGLTEQIRFRAEQSVKTNVGVFALVVGFVWQVFTISGVISHEILPWNHLQDKFPSWIGFILIFTVGIWVLKTE